MRAKFINEKFKEKSDPINDLGIGIGGLSAYNEVWTIISYGDTEIYEIFLSKTKAENAAKQKNKEYYDYYRNTNKKMSDQEFEEYFNSRHIRRNKKEVKSLADAIDWIKDAINDSNYMQEE